MAIGVPFFPLYGSNQVVTSSAAAGSIALQRSPRQVRITNTGASKAYVRISYAAAPVSATAFDLCIPSGMSTTVSKGEQDSLSHVSAGGTTLEVMVGEGF